jgi:antitoxin HigA-1
MLREPSHPGLILKEEYMGPNKLTVLDVAAALKTPHPLITRFLNREFDINLYWAVKLGKFTGTTPEFWMNLQEAHTRWSVENNDSFKEMLATIPTIEEYLTLKGTEDDQNNSGSIPHPVHPAG